MFELETFLKYDLKIIGFEHNVRNVKYGMFPTTD